MQSLPGGSDLCVQILGQILDFLPVLHWWPCIVGSKSCGIGGPRCWASGLFVILGIASHLICMSGRGLMPLLLLITVHAIMVDIASVGSTIVFVVFDPAFGHLLSRQHQFAKFW